jgi:hypothetical protein
MLSGSSGAATFGLALQQAPSKSVERQFGGFVDGELAHDVGAMNGRSAGSDVELRGDFLVGLAKRNQPKHLQTALGKWAGGVAQSGSRQFKTCIQDKLPRSDSTNGSGKVQVGALQKIAARPNIDGGSDIDGLRVHAQNENRGAGSSLKNSLRCHGSGDGGKSKVHDDDVGAKAGREANCFQPVGGFADHRELRVIFQEAPKRSPDKVMVVYQENGDHIRARRTEVFAPNP